MLRSPLSRPRLPWALIAALVVPLALTFMARSACLPCASVLSAAVLSLLGLAVPRRRESGPGDQGHGGAWQPPAATILVPSYRRPDALVQCLDGIFAGSRLPDQVVVVLRDTDEQSHQALREWLDGHPDHAGTVEPAEVSEPGQAAATNAGLRVARGEVICFLDDDCVPSRHWLRTLLEHYRDPDVVGAGGRDIVHLGGRVEARPRPVVGRLTWYGRLIGNHHQPRFDDARKVDHLKGANMSFRAEAVEGFDPNIIGAHLTDTDASLCARRAGGTIVYDPHATVDHYPAPRTGGFSRASETPEEIHADAHDYAYVMRKHLSGTRVLGFWVFALLAGQDRRYGLLRLLVRLPVEGATAARRWWHTLRGLLAGARTRAVARREEGSGRG